MINLTMHISLSYEKCDFHKNYYKKQMVCVVILFIFFIHISSKVFKFLNHFTYTNTYTRTFKNNKN